PDYRPFFYGSPGWQPLAGDWEGVGSGPRSPGAYAVPVSGSGLVTPGALLSDPVLLQVANLTRAAVEPGEKPRDVFAAVPVGDEVASATDPFTPSDLDGEPFGRG